MADPTVQGNASYVLDVQLKLSADIERTLKKIDSLGKQVANMRKDLAAGGSDMSKFGSSAQQSAAGVDAASKSMQGWIDRMNQFEAEMTTLPQKIDIVKTKLRELNASGQQGGAAWQAYTAEMFRLQDAQSKLSAASRGSVENFRQLRQGVQNTSFQLTDMVVSLQNGTKASVAFSQQMPQILGQFGAIGAAAGLAAVAIGVVFGDAINKFATDMGWMKDKSAEAEGAFKDLEDAMKDLNSASVSFNLDGFKRQFNEANIEGRKLLVTLLELNVAKAMDGLADGIKKTTDALKDAGTAGVSVGESLRLNLPKWLGGEGLGGEEYAAAAEFQKRTNEMRKSMQLFGVDAASMQRVLNGLSDRTLDGAEALKAYGDAWRNADTPESKNVLATVRKYAEGTITLKQAQEELAKVQDHIAKNGLAENFELSTKSAGKAKDALADLRREYESLQKSVATPEETLKRTLEAIEKVRVGLKLGDDDSFLARAAEKAQQDFQKAVDTINKANFDQAKAALDPFNRGVLAAGEAMVKAGDDADVLAGKLSVFKSLEFGSENWKLLATELGKAAPLMDQVKLAWLSLQENADAPSNMADAIKRVAEELALTDEQVKELKKSLNFKDAKEDLDILSVALGQGLQQGISGLIDVFQDADKSFQEFASNFLKQIAKMILQAQLLKMIKQSSFAGWFGFAKGAPFSQPTGLPHGVYTQPTYFPMPGNGPLHRFATGGVLGEAGPEAIMPLKRTSDGRLGVEASGGGTSISIIDQRGKYAPAIEVSETNKSDGSKEISVLVRAELKKAFGDGSMDRTMRSMYGVGRAPA